MYHRLFLIITYLKCETLNVNYDTSEYNVLNSYSVKISEYREPMYYKFFINVVKLITQEFILLKKELDKNV